MRILHIQFAGPFSEGMGYQENILPKYHVRLGHDVFFLTNCFSWVKGDLVHVSPGKKLLKDGFMLERMEFVNLGLECITKKFRVVKDVEQKLDEINPDFIMLHGVQSFANYGIINYLKKHPSVTMIVDNHTDFGNSAKNLLSKYILHGVIWKHLAHILVPYTKMFYGVLPARVNFLKSMYTIPSNKCDLLVMGADDELVQQASDRIEKVNIRQKHGIKADDFLIVTGGKIDFKKKKVLNLMDAVNRIHKKKVKLIVFGSVVTALKNDVFKRCSEYVQYIGWIESALTYDYFAIADLAIFPGGHSVFWEQACGQGLPLIVKKWEDMTHLDMGGNVIYLEQASVFEIENNIRQLMNRSERYYFMKSVAVKRAMKHFSYKNIAAKCLNLEGPGRTIFL